MGNKFHRSAVKSMVKKFTAPEVIGILEQYRREVSEQGRDKGVHTNRIGPWFSGQLKQLSNQLQQGTPRHHATPPTARFDARTCHPSTPPCAPAKSIPTAPVASPALELPEWVAQSGER